ncbi:MAG: cyclic nucleotide-binding domain-containing protein [Spirochaetaceae bacterium]|jgi:CRP-like cAMP-binding protein|nr:cyclic nucleotide-binding domain-containing protein [Spirochaetaceae bacterium]
MTGSLQLAFVNYKKDSYIVVEGKPNADRFFIIRQGKVRIFKDVEVVEEEGGSLLGPGDFFGVVSTMSSHSHIETAQAITDVTLISVMREQYGQLIQNNTPVAMKIILQFSKRMRYLDEALTRLTLKSNAQEDATHLYKVAEYYTRQTQYNQAYYAYHQYIKYCPRDENVNKARELMMKIAPYAKSVKLDYNAAEFNRLYPKDCMIFSEGEPGEELFIIQTGSVKIAKIVDNNEVLLAVLKSGDIFGEMALLESKPRAACAVAYEDCHVMAVNRVNFERMVGTQPQIVARLTTLLAERIWFIYKQLANTLISDPIGRMYDALLIQLEKNRISINSSSYTFDFGPKELVNMVGIPQNEGVLILRKLLENNKIQILKDKEKDKIHSLNVSDIAKQTEYYRKMQKIEKARQTGTAWSTPVVK